MTLFDLGYPPHEHASSRPGYRGTSMQRMLAAFPSEEACFRHLLETRFGPDPRCPRCGGSGRWQRHAVQKHIFHPCGGIISPMAGCLFHRTRVPLQLWFYALLHFANSSQSIVTSFLARQLGISQPTAFRMAARIRLHLAAIDEHAVLGTKGGYIFVRILTVRRVSNTRRNAPNRARIVALGDGERVLTTAIRNPSRSDLSAILSARADPTARIVTDCAATYRAFAAYGSCSPLVEKHTTFFLDCPGEVDRIHGFMSYFWNSFADQFRTVTDEAFWKYLKEYEFRYNRRASSQQTFWDMVSQFPDLEPADIKRIRIVNCRFNRPRSSS